MLPCVPVPQSFIRFLPPLLKHSFVVFPDLQASLLFLGILCLFIPIITPFMQNMLNKYKLALPGKAKAKEENIQRVSRPVWFSFLLCFVSSLIEKVNCIHSSFLDASVFPWIFSSAQRSCQCFIMNNQHIFKHKLNCYQSLTLLLPHL